MATTPRDPEKEALAQPKPRERDTLRREIDRIARQLEGLTKSLKRVKETV